MSENNEYYLADAIEVIEEVLASGGEFRLYPKGTSMLPLIVQGRDSVVLKRKNLNSSKMAPAKKWDIAFYRRLDGHFVLHRVMKIEMDGTYTMCGDNQYHLEKGINASQIIGVADILYRKDKRISRKSLCNKIYLLFWSRIAFRRLWRGTISRLSKIKRKISEKKKKDS